MKSSLFAIRPEPGLGETLAAARAQGLTIHGEPLFGVEPVAWEPVSPEAVDGLLVGSANAIRHAGEGLESVRGRPVYAVGARTAGAARGAGLQVAATGEGGLQALLDTLAPPLRLLRLAGEQRVELTPPPGVSLAVRTVYRARPLPMSEDLAAQLGRGGVVLLHSGEAAAHLARECDRCGVARAGLALAALAPRIGERAGDGWAAIRAAERPEDGALLALARDMCQESGQGSMNGR